MNLVLYKSNETNFDTLGIGALRDFTTIPLITEVLKGEYILEFNYAKDGKYCEYLLNQNIIKALGQPFRIFSVDPSNDGYRVLAKHIYYDLKNNFLEDVAPTSKTSQEALKWILDRTVFDNCFNVSGDCTELASSRYVRMTPYEAIFNADNSILNRYGGEPEFDNYNIIIHQKRGRDTGVEIREGKNLKGIKITKDFSNIITKIYPIGSNGLVLPEKYVTSDLINNYDTPRIDKREFSDIGINDETSEEEAYELLRNACKKMFADGIDKPVISVSVDFIELSKTREYRKYKNLETLELGDTIRVYIPSLNQDYSIRVIKIIKNALTGTITNLELGNETPSLITYQNNINKSVDSSIKKTYTSVLAEAKDDLTKFINHPYNGHLIISEETGEIFIMDTTDVATAKEVWKFGLGGWGFSSSGIDGPYQSGLTKDGHFVADWITTGKMSVERIEGLSQLLLTITSGQEQIEKDITTSKDANGNPIEVTDAGEYPIKSIGINGKSCQKIYKGNQLVDLSNMSKTSNANYTFENDILIERCINQAYPTIYYNITDIAKANKGKKLYFNCESYDYSNGNKPNVGLQINRKKEDGTSEISYITLFDYLGNKTSYTIPNDFDNITYIRFRFICNNTPTVGDYSASWTKPILSFKENIEYEPYVGSMPSPSPEYPQEIKAVEGKAIEGKERKWLEQIAIGKNKYNDNHPIENAYCDANGNRIITSTLGETFINQKYISINKKLSFSFKEKVGNAFVRLCEYKKDATFIKRTLINSNTEIILSNDTSFVIWSVDKNDKVHFIDLQIEEGEITSYEEYKENAALIDMNKSNLFSLDDFVNDSTNANIYEKVNDSLVVKQNDSRVWDNIKYAISVESNACYNCLNFKKGQIAYYTNELKWITTINFYPNMSFVTPSNCKFIKIKFFADSYPDTINCPYLFEGYGPYYEFASIDDTRDIFLDGLFTEKINKVMLNGNENWNITSAYEGYLRFSLVGGILPYKANKAMNNRFVQRITQAHGAYEYIYLQPNTNVVYVQILPSRLETSDVAGFKKYLSKNTIELHYELDKYRSYNLNYGILKLHKGYNYITLNDELYPNMEIGYLTDSKFNANYTTKSEFNMKSDEILSEVNGKFQEYTKTTEMNASIKEQVNSETAKVEISVSQKIDDIQIGGTNLVPNSDEEKIYIPSGYVDLCDVEPASYGEEYTISFDAWVVYAQEESGYDGIVAKIGTYIEGDAFAGVKEIHATLTTKPQRITYTYTINNDDEPNAKIFGLSAWADSENETIHYRKIKVEKGNKATDWSPAPEDKANTSQVSRAAIMATITKNGTSAIDMEADEIAFISKYFSVTKHGYITATGGTIGGFTLSPTSFSSNINSVYDYDAYDLNIIRNLILDNIDLTNALLKLFDTNNDGQVNAADMLRIQKILDGTATNQKNIVGTFNINTKDPKRCLTMYSGNVLMCSIGLGQMYIACAEFDLALVRGKKVVCSTYNGIKSVNSVGMMFGETDYLEIVSGNGAYGVSAWASDIRLKHSINDTNIEALDIINKIRHRSFIRNDDESDKVIKIGYVADELQEIDEQLIFEVGPQKIKQPRESYIIPLLSKGEQELFQLLNKQQKQIDELIDKVNKLEKERGNYEEIK